MTEPQQSESSVPPEAVDGPINERPGSIIGSYKLLQEIGEGGFGVVFMADQQEPIQRKVALKVVKPGMDTRQVIARFEAERQALALMNHPNIAKVFDAGTTESGRPYFVMELVKGIPITEYCDREHLTPKERLELFIPVCQAVQHAHQKGIIHRDLKPTNVLVALYDGRPVPKVIDFGVAKATSTRLTEKTMFTHFGQIVGTLEYMSPEQAELNQLDIDTRSDVYSLGVLLYELLTGTTPFEAKRLRSAAFDELLRIIREEEPPKPSTRLSTSETLPSIAANRKMEPQRLAGLVRGELDWIVMKTLEKDRTHRYETANGFAADVQRYLDDEPVEACPPAAAYRFRKFARRNKAALITAAVVTGVLLLGTAVSTWQAIRAQNAVQYARQELKGMDNLANTYLLQGRYEEAEDLLAEVTRIRRRTLGDGHPLTLSSLNSLGKARAEQGRYEEAGELYEEALEIGRRALGPEHSVTLESQNDLSTVYIARGNLYGRRGQWDKAAADFTKAIELDPEEHWNWYKLAPLRLQIGDVEGYRRHCLQMLQRFGQTDNSTIARRTARACQLTPDAVDDPHVPAALAEFAMKAAATHSWSPLVRGEAHYRVKEFEQAAERFRQAASIGESRDYRRASTHLFLSMALHRQGQAEEARQSLAEARRIMEADLPQIADGDLGGAWHDWLMCQIIRREAEELIEQKDEG
jgi:tetratricopeptide (TPR) repeat protein